MSNKTSVSNATNYQDIGIFWDTHDATEFGEQIDAEFEVNIKSQQRYFFLDNQLSLKIKQIATRRGISGSSLLNLWVQEKIKSNSDC
ncbi:CopG family antitoxin [Thiotrichales bacterium HSG1]|nr:CopG family antitoxin [Thiotrichales bacterium HSG1]